MKQVIRKIGYSLMAFALTFMSMSGLMEGSIVKAQVTVDNTNFVIISDGTPTDGSGTHGAQCYNPSCDGVLYITPGTTYDSIKFTPPSTLTIKNMNTPKLTSGSPSNVSFWGIDFTYVFEGTNYIQQLAVDGNSTIKMAAGAS